MNIILLSDYNNLYYSSVRMGNQTMNIEALKKYFKALGIDIIVKKFSEVDFENENYYGKHILYTSSEDRHLYYKDYIEDILLGLQECGAILIPEFKYFRAHHNKNFMEILRQLNSNRAIKNIHAKIYGTFEDMEKDLESLSAVNVLKAPDSAVSRGIILTRGKNELVKAAKKISMSPVMHDSITQTFFDYFITKNIRFVRKIKRIIEDLKLRKKTNIYSDPISRHRKKFILQDYIENLNYDFKVLVYGEKYYVLKRGVRENDFRASGSGIFDWPEELPQGLLDFAEAVFEGFNAPFVSLDIAFDGQAFYLFEFQFLYFGNYTLEFSTFFFRKEKGEWKKITEEPVLEREFANSIMRFINEKMNGN